LLFWQTVSIQNSMYDWVRDHRVHHKYTDTNADPHNSKRGFFFSHMGWLVCKKHPDVKKFGAKVEMDDLEADPIVMLQHKYMVPLSLTLNLAIPLALSLFYGESFVVLFYKNAGRLTVMLHLTWCINSVAHMWGNRPYDR